MSQLTFEDLVLPAGDEKEEEETKQEEKKPLSHRRCPKCGVEAKWISLALVCDKCGIIG
jgi:peptide subunit release factor 1 (eRF1)